MSRTATACPARTPAARTAPARNAAPSGSGCRPTTARWVIDAARSTLQVSVKVGLLATVHGRFADITGFVEIAADPSRSAVSVTVGTASLTSGNHTMDTLLQKAGVVDCEKNPVIVFASRELRPGATAGSWWLDGLLATDGGVLDVSLAMNEPETGTDGALVFRAAGSMSSKDAVRLLSHPGVERVLGKTMGLDLTVVAVPQ